MNKVLTIIIASLFSANIFAQGGWVKPKGKGYFKLGGQYLSADENFKENGNTGPTNTTFKISTISLYGEYGLTDKFTGLIYTPVVRAVQNGLETSSGGGGFEGSSYTGLGDIDLGLKYKLFANSKIAVSATLKLGLPTGEAVPQGDRKALVTGDGEFNQLLLIGAGIPLYNAGKSSVYTNVYLGLNNRTEDFSEEFRYGAELGYGFGGKLWLFYKLDAINSFENGDAGSADGSSLFGNNIEFVAHTFEGAYYLTKKIGLSANVATVSSGKNVLAGATFSGGIFYDF